MGNANSSNSETINWNNVKTENMSSSIPNFTGLSKEAQQLISSLNIPDIVDSEISEFNLNGMLDVINSGLKADDKQKFNHLLEQVSAQSDELSNTSPFISSEMYNYMVNSKTSESPKQKGGASKKSKSKKSRRQGGGDLDDDSDTSSTSSDSELEDLLETTEEEILKKKAQKKDKKKDKKEDSEEELSGGNLSYLSSSAHTDGDFSDSKDKESTDKDDSSSSSISDSDSSPSSDSESSTVENENDGVKGLSVNTDDINMVSDYD